jgi:hypothetical protein
MQHRPSSQGWSIWRPASWGPIPTSQLTDIRLLLAATMHTAVNTPLGRHLNRCGHQGPDELYLQARYCSDWQHA